jgi:hypothetical protein
MKRLELFTAALSDVIGSSSGVDVIGSSGSAFISPRARRALAENPARPHFGALATPTYPVGFPLKFPVPGRIEELGPAVCDVMTLVPATVEEPSDSFQPTQSQSEIQLSGIVREEMTQEIVTEPEPVIQEEQLPSTITSPEPAQESEHVDDPHPSKSKKKVKYAKRKAAQPSAPGPSKRGRLGKKRHM